MLAVSDEVPRSTTFRFRYAADTIRLMRIRIPRRSVVRAGYAECSWLACDNCLVVGDDCTGLILRGVLETLPSLLAMHEGSRCKS